MVIQFIINWATLKKIPNWKTPSNVSIHRFRTPDIGLAVRVFTNGRETWVQSQVESYQRLQKYYLMPPCLTLSIIRYGPRLKWRNPGKGVAPSTTPWCSSCRKGNLRATLDYGRQLYLLYIDSCLKINFYQWKLKFIGAYKKHAHRICWSKIQKDHREGTGPSNYSPKTFIQWYGNY